MKLNTILITLAALAGGVGSAQAVPELQILIDGVSVGPAESGFQSGGSGSVTYNFDYTVGGLGLVLIADETGTVGGTGAAPTLGITSINVSTVAGVTGSLEVILSDTGFGPTNAGAQVQLDSITPVAGALTTLSTYYSTTNALFAEDTAIAAIGPTTLTAGVNQYNYGQIASGASDYSLTDDLTITGMGQGTMLVGAVLTTVPDGATTALLVGVGLLGLGVVASRRKLTLA
jgi:hypothetical protein